MYYILYHDVWFGVRRIAGPMVQQEAKRRLRVLQDRLPKRNKRLGEHYYIAEEGEVDG